MFYNTSIHLSKKIIALKHDLTNIRYSRIAKRKLWYQYIQLFYD
jgi:hypothetical protein